MAMGILLTILITVTTTAQLETPGSFQGEIPCADCAGIRMTLHLESNGTYRLQRTYLGTSDGDRSFLEQGRWSVVEMKTLVLEGGSEGPTRFAIRDSSTLRMLDREGREIESPLNYELKRSSSLPQDRAINPQLNVKKWQEGIDFYATGNEPFWSVNLDLDHSMRFDVLSGPSLTTPAVPGERAQDADVIRYRAVTESGRLTVQIIAGECTDTMSGEIFSHKVTVNFGRTTDVDDTRYEGCGRYVVNPGLNDIWVLRTIDGQEIDTSGLPKGAPTLELHITEGRAVGHTGCNNFSGSFSVERNQIRFGNVAVTMRACAGMAEEARFAKALFQRSHTFELRNLELVLTDPEARELVFRKVD
jgi:heat shock protein HslJ/uncharacterized membrane protein/uncharacterized lipoprotein NlpE involved in copper resistance